MSPTPQVKAPARGRLISGRKLNELLAALRARTPLNVTGATDRGWRGVSTQGVSVSPVNDRFNPTKVYWLSAAFLARLQAGVAARMPGVATPEVVREFPAASAPLAPGLRGLSRELAQITPISPTEAGPLGYRLPPPATPGVARLEWEVESFAGYATICSLGESFAYPGSWIISWASVNVYTGGSWTDTGAASGVVSAYGPDDEPPAECAEPVYGGTFDPEQDYGDFISSDYTEETVPFADLIPPAIDALGPTSASGSAAEWPPESWRDVSEGVIPFSQLLGVVSVGADVSGASASSVRFRLHNRGACGVRVNCGHYGMGLPGGASDLPQVISLPPGQSSAWVEPPTIDPDPAKSRAAQIRRVRLSRWQGVA